MTQIPISDKEFSQFQRFIFDAAGITLSAAKKALVCGRLGKRLQEHHLDSYAGYFDLLMSGTAPDEVQIAIDLLTTNETYFFREQKHFDFLRQHAVELHRRTAQFRVWSAASSTGEEAYSIAMVLSDCLETSPWEVVGTDISMRVLQRARVGHYPLERAKYIPSPYLRRFCRKGVDAQRGTLLVERSLRDRVRFVPANLDKSLPDLGRFDVVFLRNVMIYFNDDTKRKVVERVISMLNPGGYLYIGHSESLNDITRAVKMVAPSVYMKPSTNA